jgi:hypothetical protein
MATCKIDRLAKSVKMINGEYAGPLKEGVRDGPGRLEWANGDYYEGDFRNGLRHGRGVMVEQTGKRRYEGTWVLSQKDGKGVEVFANGDKYIGEYSRDRFHGEGELVTKGGVYHGSFKDGLRDGFGIMQFRTNCRYEGFWAKGRMEGKGLYIWPDSRKYEGQWENGERTGMGVLTQVNGEKYGKSVILCLILHPSPPAFIRLHLIVSRRIVLPQQDARRRMVEVHTRQGASRRVEGQ